MTSFIYFPFGCFPGEVIHDLFSNKQQTAQIGTRTVISRDSDGTAVASDEHGITQAYPTLATDRTCQAGVVVTRSFPWKLAALRRSLLA